MKNMSSQNMAEISAGLSRSGEEPYCRHWGGKQDDLSATGLPPETKAEALKAETKFLLVSCCSVRVSANRS